MNTEQQNAVDVALQGHNLLITGAAGTGKSFVLSYIYKTMKDRGINVHLTCTTGVSCAVYPTGMATTVHRFAGILDCRHGSSEIRDVLRSNRKFDEVVQRINETDVLIIDECSMLSKRTFEILNAACQLKDASKFFGGMQLILCGDFLQLPPVANNLYRDDGSFCFESSIFYNVVPHKVVLCEIMRQSAAEAEFKQVISEVCKGNVSENSSHFIECLSRPLPETQHFEPTLFATNQQVDSFNRNNILEMPGVLYEFQSADTGENRYLDRLTCQKVLWLKIGMPVILIRNLTDNLYNGLRGIVHDIDKDGPSVTFPTGTIRIQKVTFDVFSPSVNANIASRIQYPLKPAFGITIHKAQGMTLERVNVDCQQIFKPGQLGVALSRARSCEGIRVINYDPKYCIRQPQIISDFISEDTVPVNEDVSCCKGLLTR
ncbi:uncharacterized protein LOC128552247 [Mercenaria mercenaria]|uniref:uncharacterized protein LOC128552247 n=1 Tax=Mercenaria mercenaria TaxID=6596 RepID=UPI00234E743B|nr:uncharacterized protein LOC128552247 [Mercenaria mercenaria]